jgi:hypothetical protein
MAWEKPLVAAAATDTFCEEPSLRVRLPGLAESEKPAGAAAAVTARARDAVLVIVPMVPAN